MNQTTTDLSLLKADFYSLISDAVPEEKTGPIFDVFEQIITLERDEATSELYCAWTAEDVFDVNRHYSQEEAIEILEAFQCCEDACYDNLRECCEEFGVPAAAVDKLSEFMLVQFQTNPDRELLAMLIADVSGNCVIESHSSIYCDLDCYKVDPSLIKALKQDIVDYCTKHFDPIDTIKVLGDLNVPAQENITKLLEKIERLSHSNKLDIEIAAAKLITQVRQNVHQNSIGAWYPQDVTLICPLYTIQEAEAIIQYAKMKWDPHKGFNLVNLKECCQECGPPGEMLNFMYSLITRLFQRQLTLEETLKLAQKNWVIPIEPSTCLFYRYCRVKPYDISDEIFNTLIKTLSEWLIEEESSLDVIKLIDNAENNVKAYKYR